MVTQKPTYYEISVFVFLLYAGRSLEEKRIAASLFYIFTQLGVRSISVPPGDWLAESSLISPVIRDRELFPLATWRAVSARTRSA